MEQYCLYLRKSRADIEAEARGEGETLARHERALLELAKKYQLNVTQIYREIVSGETIAARPVMQQLLSEVGQGVWAGVLVMEVERLARGDTIDQGIVAQTFKYSGTQIITPAKTYNPDNEYDQEYFEFGLFMSRREYVTINRRLQRGRIASVKEGKFVGNKPPYGYKRVAIPNDKGYTLEIIPTEADVVRLIFEWYTHGVQQDDDSRQRIGTQLIARRLNSMNIPSATNKQWMLATVRDILTNPVYIGKVRWNWRSGVKKMVGGRVQISRPRNSDVLICNGLHPAIVAEDVFNLAQDYMKRNPPRPVKAGSPVKNPLAGLVVCGECGRRMVRRPYTKRTHSDTLICAAPECHNVGSDLALVESKILDALREWLDGYKLRWRAGNFPDEPSQVKVLEHALAKSKSELQKLSQQLSKTHDLLEQGIYDTETFLQRSREISGRISAERENIASLDKSLREETARAGCVENIIPNVEKLLDVYQQLPTPQDKNDMLKGVLEKVVYIKKRSARWKDVSPDDFEITIFPKIPPIE